MRLQNQGILWTHQPHSVMRDLLFVAFHFPPLHGSSGIQRTLAFARHLPRHGWRTHVLTTTLNAYERVSAESLSLIPPDTQVYRAWALDSRRHLSICGRYIDSLAVPDRWQSWVIPAIVRGVWLARRLGAAAVCSTYPIASAHIVGYGISRLTGLPWIADLRDPMLQNDFPHGALRRRAFGWIERRIVAHARRILVTTPGAAEFYFERYPAMPRDRIVVIENGYDEQIFPTLPEPPAAAADRPLTLLHSGLIYGQERDPRNLFGALRDLLPRLAPLRVRVVLRAPGEELPWAQVIAEYGLQDVVEVRPPIPYQQALAEMMAADALLILQACNCNRQIPAKAYEYCFAGRPIIGLTDPAGDTGRLLARLGVPAVAALEDQAAITQMLANVLPQLRDGTYPPLDAAQVAALSRSARTAELAAVLDAVVAEAAA